MTQPTTQAPARKLNLGRLERLRRLLQYGAALVLLVFLVLIALAWTELGDLNARRDKARRELEATMKALDDARKELGLTKSTLDAAQSANNVLSGVAEAYKEEHPDKAEMLTDAVRSAVEASITQSAEQAGRQPGAAAQIPPRVYIQILHAGQRARAADVARLLQAKGFVVPGVENVERTANPQGYSDVRYNPADESSAGDVADIRAVMQENFGVSVRETKLRAPGGTRARQYELWLGDDFTAPEGTTRPEGVLGSVLGRILAPRGRPTPSPSPQDDRRPPAEQKTPGRNYPRRTSP
jgi:hypothetical protein